MNDLITIYKNEAARLLQLDIDDIVCEYRLQYLDSSNDVGEIGNPMIDFLSNREAGYVSLLTGVDYMNSLPSFGFYCYQNNVPVIRDVSYNDLNYLGDSTIGVSNLKTSFVEYALHGTGYNFSAFLYLLVFRDKMRSLKFNLKPYGELHGLPEPFLANIPLSSQL